MDDDDGIVLEPQATTTTKRRRQQQLPTRIECMRDERHFSPCQVDAYTEDDLRRQMARLCYTTRMMKKQLVYTLWNLAALLPLLFIVYFWQARSYSRNSGPDSLARIFSHFRILYYIQLLGLLPLVITHLLWLYYYGKKKKKTSQGSRSSIKVVRQRGSKKLTLSAVWAAMAAFVVQLLIMLYLFVFFAVYDDGGWMVLVALAMQGIAIAIVLHALFAVQTLKVNAFEWAILARKHVSTVPTSSIRFVDGGDCERDRLPTSSKDV